MSCEKGICELWFTLAIQTPVSVKTIFTSLVVLTAKFHQRFKTKVYPNLYDSFANRLHSSKCCQETFKYSIKIFKNRTLSSHFSFSIRETLFGDNYASRGRQAHTCAVRTCPLIYNSPKLRCGAESEDGDAQVCISNVWVDHVTSVPRSPRACSFCSLFSGNVLTSHRVVRSEMRWILMPPFTSHELDFFFQLLFERIRLIHFLSIGKK